MEPRNELKAKARELEHGDHPEEALALYVQLLDRAEHPSPAMLAHAGELQLRLGQPENAGQNLGRAIDGFAEVGQLNNAIALAYRLADARVGEPDVHLRLGELALTQGYRRIARDSIGAFARAALPVGRADDAVEPIVAFLRRFPDEQELWRDWAEELLGMGRDDDAVDGLRRLANALAGGATETAATAIRAEIARLRPQPGAPVPVDSPAAAPELDDGAEGDLPLLGNLPEAPIPRADVEDEMPIAPLAGLQTTHADWGEADSPEEVSEPLPLIDTSPEVDPEDPSAVPLPLLGTAPEVGEEGPPSAPTPQVGPAPELDQERYPAPPAPNPAFDREAAVAALAGLTAREVEAAEEPSTHYDLGVAFKEMGLVDESIAHLAAALARGHDPVATLEVLGEILVARGQYDLAARLMQGLAGAGNGSPELLGIRYWLARSAEELGAVEDARRYYQQIIAVDTAFRDTSVRLDRLSSSF